MPVPNFKSEANTAVSAAATAAGLASATKTKAEVFSGGTRTMHSPTPAPTAPYRDLETAVNDSRTCSSSFTPILGGRTSTGARQPS